MSWRPRNPGRRARRKSGWDDASGFCLGIILDGFSGGRPADVRFCLVSVGPDQERCVWPDGCDSAEAGEFDFGPWPWQGLIRERKFIVPVLRPFAPSGERDARRRTGGADAFVGVSLEPLEIVAEHLHHAPRHFGEFSLAAPSLDRFENVRLDAGHLRWHGEAEIRIGAEIRAL